MDIKELHRGIKSLGCLALLLFSCSKAEEPINFTPDDAANLQIEETMYADLEEISDMAATVLITDQDIQKGMRTIQPADLHDGRYMCASVSVEFASDNIPESPGVTANPHGYITMDFGTGCASTTGTIRKGKMLIEFSGRRFVSGSSITISFDQYSVDGIHVEGTRSETDVQTGISANPVYQSSTTVTFTFPDGTIATRTGDLTRRWNSEVWHGFDQLSVESVATGKTRNGKDYTVTTTKSLSYWRKCADDLFFMPLEGIKELEIDSRKIIVDYGKEALQLSTGTTVIAECNNEVTVTVDGKSKVIDIIR